jgi:pimeloyl-ACP methyl ester carboxylesterase
MVEAPMALALVRKLTGAVLTGVLAALSAQAAEDIQTLTTRPGVTEQVLVIHPTMPPVASAVLFVGGPGKAGLKTPWTPGRRGGNFLYHLADRFVADGVLVALVDVPSDHSDGLWDWHTSREHATDIAAVIAALRAAAPVPVWLIGHSMGTLSAASAAALLKTGGPDGIVLASSVTEKSRQSVETVRSVRLEDITVPVLLVHHEQDYCPASPYAGAETVMDRLRNSRKHELMAFNGGATPKSGVCDSQAPHGYWGIGNKVVDAIVAWIKAAR